MAKKRSKKPAVPEPEQPKSKAKKRRSKKPVVPEPETPRNWAEERDNECCRRITEDMGLPYDSNYDDDDDGYYDRDDAF